MVKKRFLNLWMALIFIVSMGPEPILARNTNASKSSSTQNLDQQTLVEVKKILQDWQNESEIIKRAHSGPNIDPDEWDDGDVEPQVATPENAEDSEKVDQFVDKATLDYLRSDNLENLPLQNGDLEKYRTCPGDGYNETTKMYEENVSDECLLPKISIAARLFNIRYSFAKCIFEKENPDRDRLAHSRNGNGLAQIVNKTMLEISRRWEQDDELSVLLKQCVQLISNRDQRYRETVDTLIIPVRVRKSNVVNEASHQAPTHRLNPLYRDDAICLGMMTMAIKVDEAQSHRNGGISDHELAKRYNGSWLKRRYAKDIVSCVERQPKEEKSWGGFFGFIKIPKMPF